jgi:hypothetical protein
MLGHVPALVFWAIDLSVTKDATITSLSANIPPIWPLASPWPSPATV